MTCIIKQISDKNQV